MKCVKCGSDIEMREMDITHIIPRALFSDKKFKRYDLYNGVANRRYLCKKCHNIYDLQVMGCLCRFIIENGLEEEAKKYVWRSHKWWVKKKNERGFYVQ